uniref:WASH complex subunit 3 n=1 Tax=Balaenoptera musculus TaxID=9771 RepID=A0A8C0CHP6_BALMU
MDEDGLPLTWSGIDLTKVPAIQQKRTVAFLNQFVVHTVQFLNPFSAVCEEKSLGLVPTHSGRACLSTGKTGKSS